MNDEKFNNEMDDFFRKELENLPEEKPSADDWQQMNLRIKSDGLLGNNSNGRKYFFLVLLFALLSGFVSLPFLMKNKIENVKKETIQPVAKSGNENATNKNVTFETKGVATAEEKGINSGTASLNEPPAYLPASKNKITGAIKMNSFTKTNVEKRVGEENKSAPQTGEKEITANDVGKNDAVVPLPGDNISKPESNAADEKINSSGVTTASTQTGTPDENNIPSTLATGDTLSTASEKSLAAGKNDSTLLAADNKISIRDSTARKRFRLGIYVSLDYNYYSLKKNTSAAQAESDYVRQSDLMKDNKWGGQYTVGIIGGYLFTQKLSLEAGVFYSQKKKLHADIYTPAYSANSGEEIFSDFTYDYKGRYVEIYGRAKYYLSQKKNSFYATLGAAGSFNLPAHNDSSDYFSRTSYSEFSNPERERVNLNASSASLVMVISAGVEIPVGAKWNVYIEPAYRHSFSPVTKHPTYDRIPVELFLRSFSLASGLMYKF